MSKHKTKFNENDAPCFKEQELSYACLKKNDYDQKKCSMYFDNYNACKKFWGTVETNRRRKGIQPAMPDLAERIKIKEELHQQYKN